MNQKISTKITIGVLAIVAIGTAGYLVFNQKNSGATPTPSPTPNPLPTSSSSAPIPPDDTIVSASLGQQFTLHKDQIAKIADTGLEITITAFYNSPCPAGVQCIWSGVGIGFEYRLNGQVKTGIDLVEAFGYRVTIVKTDHETYADLIVTSATASTAKIYKDQATCERETGKSCRYTTCDYAPPGKTIEEVCGVGPSKGWMPSQ